MATLLLVEDDPRIQSALRRSLAARGHVVECVGTGRQGLERALHGGPDLVVLDLGLPDIDGGQLLRMLRAVSRVQVIEATAHDDHTSAVGLHEHGADDSLD